MRDLRHPRWMWFKAVLFVVIGTFSGLLLLVEAWNWRSTLLLCLWVWGFCRAYYFAFYVIERWVDPTYQFSGLGSFVAYCLRRRGGKGLES